MLNDLRDASRMLLKSRAFRFGAFTCAATLRAASALVACVAPTLRALRADPLTSLRSQ
jgi:ABC-type lipoprotein release transport system permease subunit